MRVCVCACVRVCVCACVRVCVCVCYFDKQFTCPKWRPNFAVILLTYINYIGFCQRPLLSVRNIPLTCLGHQCYNISHVCDISWSSQTSPPIDISTHHYCSKIVLSLVHICMFVYVTALCTINISLYNIDIKLTEFLT